MIQFRALASELNRNASIEAALESRLIAIQRRPDMQEIYLDILERWRLIGGGVYVGQVLTQPWTKCPTGGKNCGNLGMFEDPFFSDPLSWPKYYSLIAYKAGRHSSLPFTSEGMNWTLPLEKKGSCLWGTRYKGRCVCYAGYSGTDCTTRVPKPNDCTDDAGINLAGLADWSSELLYVDIFKSSRAWISQTFAWDTPWSTGAFQNLSARDYPNMLYPNQKLGAMMIRDLQNYVPGGLYVVLYDGDGILRFSMDVVKVRIDPIYDHNIL
jgi:hypothetical protein